MIVDAEEILQACDDVIKNYSFEISRLFKTGMLSIPDIQKWREWAVQKYHQVYRQNIVFSIVHAKSGINEDVRQWMVQQLIAEETSLTSGSAPHYTLMKRFALACGAQSNEFEPQNAAKEVLNYVDQLRGICWQEHFVYGLLAIYSVEAQSGVRAATLLNLLQSMNRFNNTQLEWFTVHATEEDHHAHGERSLIIKYGAQLEDFKVKATQITEYACQLWSSLQQYYLQILGDL